VKAILLSDTHETEALLRVPEGDILIHSGDVSLRGVREAILRFLDWFAEQPHKYKVLVAGNHDRWFEQEPARAATECLQRGIHYLMDRAVMLEGRKFYGSPWQPWFCDWAYNLKTVEERASKWDRIPEDTEILVTHSAPHRIFDMGEHERMGCEALRHKVLRGLPKLRLHTFGHVHPAYGNRENVRKSDGRRTMFVNAATCNSFYIPSHKPVEIDL
jgi:Icc-related predicted phosphoesterase